jgi:outer membrane lipoprotein-sorting protein
LKKTLVFLCLCLTASPRAFTTGRLALQELLERMEQRQAALRDIQFDFEQTLSIASANRTETSRGHAFFKAHRRFRIERSNTRRQIFVCNGRKLWVYTPAFKQVLASSWKGWARTRQLPPGLVDFQDTVDRLKKGCILALEDSPNSGAYILTAVPKDKSRSGEVLKLWIDPEEFLPVRIELWSGSTEIQTKVLNLTLNKGLKDSLFTFHAEDGMETIPL